MRRSSHTARELYEELRASPRRKPLGFGSKVAVVNVDLQLAYSQPEVYKTAYSGHPRRFEYINEIAALVRQKGWPVIWTYVAYNRDGSDCGVWGWRSNTEDSLQNIKIGSDRARLDPRLKVDSDHDQVWIKKMASAFHGTPLLSYLCSQRADTVIVTGGSTSGCVRATVVDAISFGFIPLVPEECVADVHESPHYASLYDMQLKYADVLSTEVVLEWLRSQHIGG